MHHSRPEKLYLATAVLFITVLILTNIIGTKLFILTIPFLDEPTKLTLTTGILTYPLTFLFTDIVSEVWGKKRADFMVYLGFAASILMLLILQVAKMVPPSPLWQIPAEYAPYFHPGLQIHSESGSVAGVLPEAAQAAFTFTFDAPGVLLFASMLAYATAQLTDNYLFHFWKKLTHGKHLWLRNNGSTLISQLIDTIIVNSIFLYFYWHLPWETIFSIIISVYLVKGAMAMIDTPLIYAGVYLVRHLLKGDPLAYPSEKDYYNTPIAVDTTENPAEIE